MKAGMEDATTASAARHGSRHRNLLTMWREITLLAVVGKSAGAFSEHESRFVYMYKKYTREDGLDL
jgi:hypothetical protein